MSWLSAAFGLDPVIAAVRSRNKSAIITALIALLTRYGYGEEAAILAAVLGGQS